MRWYGIDDITEEDTAKLAATLTEMELTSGMDGLFWLPVPAEMLSPVQQEHVESCGPHVMGLEVEENFVRLELLVRARSRMRELMETAPAQAPAAGAAPPAPLRRMK